MLSLNIFCVLDAQKFDTGIGYDKMIIKHPKQDVIHNISPNL